MNPLSIRPNLPEALVNDNLWYSDGVGENEILFNNVPRPGTTISVPTLTVYDPYTLDNSQITNIIAKTLSVVDLDWNEAIVESKEVDGELQVVSLSTTGDLLRWIKSSDAKKVNISDILGNNSWPLDNEQNPIPLLDYINQKEGVLPTFVAQSGSDIATVGTPSVTIDDTESGVIKFVFHQLKGATGAKGSKGATGAAGAKGSDGISITSASVSSANGHLTLTKSDGTSIDVGKVVGENGTNGTTPVITGQQTTTSSTDGGTNEFTFYSNGSSIGSISVKNGSKGSDGQDGQDGFSTQYIYNSIEDGDFDQISNPTSGYIFIDEGSDRLYYYAMNQWKHLEFYSGQENTYGIKINGTNYGDSNGIKLGPTSGIFAPTTGGTKNYVLVSSGSSSAPTWKSLSNAGFTNTTYYLTLNGTDEGDSDNGTSLGTIYAPTSSPYDGQLLISTASDAPEWVDKDKAIGIYTDCDSYTNYDDIENPVKGDLFISNADNSISMYLGSRGGWQEHIFNTLPNAGINKIGNILTVNSNGDPEWQTPSSSGGSGNGASSLSSGVYFFSNHGEFDEIYDSSKTYLALAIIDKATNLKFLVDLDFISYNSQQQKYVFKQDVIGFTDVACANVKPLSATNGLDNTVRLCLGDNSNSIFQIAQRSTKVVWKPDPTGGGYIQDYVLEGYIPSYLEQKVILKYYTELLKAHDSIYYTQQMATQLIQSAYDEWGNADTIFFITSTLSNENNTGSLISSSRRTSYNPVSGMNTASMNYFTCYPLA